MAPTTSIKKKIFLFFYGSILISIMVVIAGIIYFLFMEYDFTGPGNEKYEDLYNKRQSYASDIVEQNRRTTQKIEDLKNTDDLTLRTQILSELSYINDQVISDVEELLRLDSEILLLELPDDIMTEIKEAQNQDMVLSREANRFRIVINNQLFLNQFYIKEEATDKCFSSINYEIPNQDIANKIEVCKKELEEHSTYVQTRSDEFPLNLKYIFKSIEFWDKNQRLYIALDERNSSEAKKLESELGPLNSLLDEMKKDARGELEQWIASNEI
jgi:hypothetical protein